MESESPDTAIAAVVTAARTVTEWADTVPLTVDDAEDVMLTVGDIRAARDRITTVCADLEERLCATVPHRTHVTIAGTKHRVERAKRHTDWRNDDLLRAVLDSRIVDPDTGVITDETPFDRVRDVYPLSGNAARTGRLRSRGIDPYAYCNTQPGRLRFTPVR